MYKDLGLKDLLKIINTGIKSGKSPKESINDYNKSSNGGYNEWKKEMSNLMGVDISKDPRYYYKQFYDNNPENAWNLLNGKADTSILEQYRNKTYDKAINQQQKENQYDSINDLMDYSLYEKLINDYMNKSISTSFANGGKINTYAEGTEKLENAYKDTKYTSYGKPLKSNRSISDMIELSKEDFDNLTTRTIDLTEIPDEKRDEVLRGLPATTYYELPYSLMKKYDPFFDGSEEENKHIYYTKYNDDPEDYRLTVVKSGTKEGNALLDRLVFNEQLKNYVQNDNNIVLPDIVVTPDKKEVPKRKKVLADEYSIEPYINPYEELKGLENKTVIHNHNIPDEFNIDFGDDFNLLEDFKFEPYTAEPWNIQYLQPPETVPIPNWEVQQIRDDYLQDNSDFLNFMSRLMGNIGRNNIREQLMLLLMLPKDYFADPYAGNNYGDTILINDLFSNNPYNIAANGGPLNIYRGGTNNLKLSDSTRRLLLSLPSNPRSLLRTNIPVAQSDVTGRINIDKKQEQARRTNTKKVIGAAARRRAALDSYRYGDNNIGYRYRQAQAEKDPEGYMEQANAIDEARALELHTFINQETRTPLQIAVDHEKFLKNAEHEKRAEEKAKADEHLGAFMNLFKILSPSYQLGAARGVYEGNNYIDALYGDLNAGLPTFLLGQYSGKGFEEQYPLTTFGINFATDWAATKGIGAIPNAASKASNVSKLSNIAKISKASEAGPKGFPLFGGRRFYTYKQFQNNPSWYYRVGKDLAKYAEDLGVITGKMSEAPFFSKGEALTSKGLNRDIIVHKGNGNYDWANLDVEGNVTLNPRTWVDDMTGLTRMWNDVTNKPVGPTEVTPLANGKAGVANPADFTVFRPFNIFGKNFGYIERSLGQSKPTFNISGMQNTFRKAYNNSKTSNNLNANVLQTQPAFTQDLFGMNYTGYQMPKMFDINLSYLPRGFAVGPVLDTNDIVNLPTIITADNKLVTPSRWDTLQQRAISAGDLQELQKLRDYHFIELALNNNFFFPTSDTLNPATLRHVVADEYNPNFNIFDPTIEGTNSFIYTTDSVPMASSYFSKPITVQDVAKFRDYYGNLWKEGLQLRLEGFRKTLADIQEAENNGFNSLTDYYKNIGKQGYLTYSPSNSLPLTKLRMIFEQNFNTTLNDLINFLEYLNNQLAARGFNTPNPERMKTLYGALNNPVVLDANNGFWSNVGDYNINGTLYGSGSTRNVEHNIMFNHPDIDGFILNRVKDYGGRRQFGNWDPASVIGFRYPNLLKYKAGITYDDNGIIIPLSKRDNFELGDLRYSLGGNLKIK